MKNEKAEPYTPFGRGDPRTAALTDDDVKLLTPEEESGMSQDEKIADPAQVATLRLDVAWWRARVEAVEEERRAAQAKAELWARREGALVERGIRTDAEQLSQVQAAEFRAEAAEAAQAKLREALRAIVERLDGDRHFINPDGGAEMLLAARRALTSAASAPQAPPNAAEEVK